MSRFYIMFMHEMCEDPYWEKISPTYGMKNDLELDAVLGETKDIHYKMHGREFDARLDGLLQRSGAVSRDCDGRILTMFLHHRWLPLPERAGGEFCRSRSNDVSRNLTVAF